MPDAATTSGMTSTAGTLPTSFGHKPALDGLRAVAVLSVMAFHFGAGAFEGGFLGVDTFFVLSGYLITSLLLTEWGRSRTIDFVAFWARRAKRLLPALFLALLLVGIWANLEADPTRLDGIRARHALDALLRRELALHRVGPVVLRPLQRGVAAAPRVVARDRGAVLPVLAA